MRARNLKPGFFKNETLAELDPLARLLFAGLWCLADREGRLEDRPKRIKAEVLPYDACDPDDLLWALHRAGFILRYEIDKSRYIQIINFKKHQTPHIKEPPSTIPAPDQHYTGTVRALDRHESGPSESPFLNPESPFQSPNGDMSASDKPDADAPPVAKASEIVSSWNSICGDALPRVERLTEERRRKLRARMAATAERRALSWWRDYFERIRASPFLRGENDRGWRADFDWAIRSETVVARVLEGRYDARTEVRAHGDATAGADAVAGTSRGGTPQARRANSSSTRRDYLGGRYGYLVQVDDPDADAAVSGPD